MRVGVKLFLVKIKDKFTNIAAQGYFINISDSFITDKLLSSEAGNDEFL